MSYRLRQLERHQRWSIPHPAPLVALSRPKATLVTAGCFQGFTFRASGPALLVLLCMLSLPLFGQQQTLRLEDLTANNSSAATAANGTTRRAPGFQYGAVSKVPVRALLGEGSNVRVYAHLMPWFGASGHINTGYDSAHADQVRRQIEDMISRGLDGLIVYWTGPPHNDASAHTHQSALKIMAEAERHSGFEFAVQEDKQSLKDCAKGGCDLSAELARHLQFAARTFFDSPAYMRANGRPVLFFFGLEEYPIDWNRVRAAVPGQPLFIFRNSVGFNYPQSDGAFAWTTIDKADPNNIGLDYLERFYRVAGQHSGAVSIGSVYPGFNDELASWGKHRVMNGNCGQTWLRTFEEVRRHRDSLSALQIVTWNDYEEGSQIEPGIDNCVTVQASATAGSLQWEISGDAKTIHHFALWAATSGSGFALITELPPARREINFSSMALAPGEYRFVVQAVGQPSMLNHVSQPVPAAIAGH